MRVTENSMSRNYMRNLNRNLSSLSLSSSRMNSGRKFMRVSENTADAAKAFSVREKLYRNEQYLVNIRDASGEMTSAETAMMSINSTLQTARERLTQGLNGPVGDTNRETIAKEVESLRDQVLQSLNTTYGDKFLFGGTNGAGAPFTVDDAGQLFYNGMPVDATTPSAAFPENKAVYMDVGRGMTFSNGELVTNSAIQVNTSGLDLMRFQNEDGTYSNLYNVLDDAAKQLRSGDMDALRDTMKQLQKGADHMMISVTDIGTRSKVIDQNAERVETEILQLKTMQQGIEGVSIEAEAINNKTLERQWMITLQLGSKILPQSIFDFMR